jgi:2-dehydropantoate 2-reductase
MVTLGADSKVLVFGAGAVGASVGGWLAERHESVWLLDQPALVDVLNQRGLTLYENDRARATTVKVKAVSELGAVPAPDVVLIAVKTYSLDKVCGLIKERLGDAPIVVALQNGVDNQTIIPKFFTRAIYTVVAYNAWIDEPGVVGYQKKGPLVIGTPRGELADECRAVAGLLSRGVETTVAPGFLDAAYSKMIINLTNSLQALIGHPMRPVSDRALFQTVLTNLTWEGVQIVRAAGHKECRLGGMPPWWLMQAAATLPRFLTKGAFEKNVKKMVISSMAQDVLQRGAPESELETLNGHFIHLADQHRLAVPFNRTVYALCKERFAVKPFQPLDIAEVHAEVVRRRTAPSPS